MQDTKEPTDAKNVDPPSRDKDKDQPSSDSPYYYDDAHGYEEFDPDAADDDDNEDH